MVIAHSVLAHADDLRGLLEGVQQLLTRDGIFVFEVSYLLDVIKRNTVDTFRHENLDYHSVMPLVRFLHASDMELIGVEQVGSTAARLRGYAPARATTLLHQFGLGPDVIDFIVDDSPWKQGLYTPGLLIPVVPPEALYEQQPDVVVVLAWDHAEDIIARHHLYRSAGGRFIVPLPEIAVIEATGIKDQQPNA
jgi:hypothetical protein